MPYIDITVRGKIAQTDRAAFIVCGNKDYIARFDFGESSDWDKHATKTARFVRNDGTYTDVQFSGSECNIPEMVNVKSVSIGVYAGDLITSTGASVWCRKSIIDPDGLPADPPSDVYAQLMDRLDHVLDNGLPHKLTFTGASTGEYDGTADVTINIPEGGGGSGGGSTDISLGISGATTGCMTIIKTVDSNGSPTEWEAVDMPGIDSTLTVEGKAADAKATGDAINSLSSNVNAFEKIGTIDLSTMAEAGLGVDYAVTDVTEIVLVWTGMTNTTQTNSSLALAFNDSNFFNSIAPKTGKAGTAQNGYTYLKVLENVGIITIHSSGATSSTNYQTGGYPCIYNLIPIKDKIQTLKIYQPSTNYYADAGTVEVYVR